MGLGFPAVTGNPFWKLLIISGSPGDAETPSSLVRSIQALDLKSTS